MSADNGIYIGCFKDDVFRVIHAQAIDNLTYKPDNGEFNSKAVCDYFTNAKVFSTKDEALLCAGRILEEIENEGYPCEYGISFIHFPLPFSKMIVPHNSSPQEQQKCMKVQ